MDEKLEEEKMPDKKKESIYIEALARKTKQTITDFDVAFKSVESSFLSTSTCFW